MKNFFVIANSSKAEAVSFQSKIKEYLEVKGAKCVLFSASNSSDGHIESKDVPSDSECVVVLGGDGTLLQASIDLADIKIPFLGINLGTLGYLAAADKADIYHALDMMMADDYIVEPRMMIYGNIVSSGKVICDSRALNEIVITGSEPMQIVYLCVYVNGMFLHRYQADGVIVSTPTGSTGYNLSAGGPIVNPTANTMVLTPVSPHSMYNRGIVFSSDDSIRIDVEEDRYGREQHMVAVFDGSKKVEIKTGDSITIRRSEKTTKIIKLKEESFLETLHNKLEG